MRFSLIILVSVVSLQSFGQLPNHLQNRVWYGFSLETARIHNDGMECIFRDVMAASIEGQKRDPITLQDFLDEEQFIECFASLDFGVLGDGMGGEGILKALLPQILRGGLYDTLVSQVMNSPLIKGTIEGDTAMVNKENKKILSKSALLAEATERMDGYGFKDSSIVYKNIDPLISIALADTEKPDAERRNDIFQLVWYRESLLIRTYLNLEYGHLKPDRNGS